MIARLAGTIAETNSDNAVILAGGVGYQVQMSGRSLEVVTTHRLLSATCSKYLE